jgi:hypothetical protein
VPEVAEAASFLDAFLSEAVLDSGVVEDDTDEATERFEFLPPSVASSLSSTSSAEAVSDFDEARPELGDVAFAVLKPVGEGATS